GTRGGSPCIPDRRTAARPGRPLGRTTTTWPPADRSPRRAARPCHAPVAGRTPPGRSLSGSGSQGEVTDSGMPRTAIPRSGRSSTATSVNRVRRHPVHPHRWRRKPAPPRAPRARRPGATPWASSGIRAEVVVLEPHRFTRALTEGVVGVVGAVVDHLVHGRLGLLGRLHPKVAVTRQPRTGRDELPENDVLLQADQRIGLGV